MLAGPSRPQGAEVRWQTCPVCGHDKWAVSQNADSGAWTCYVCGAKGVVDMGITANVLRDKLTPRVSGPVEWEECVLPEWRTLTRTGRKYMRDRGVLRPEQFSIVELIEGGRVLIPYFGDRGRLIYWATRSFVDDGKPKYIGAPGRKPPYVLPDWRKHEQVVFVEGPLDCIVHYLATSIPTIALGGKSVAGYLRNTIAGLAGRERSLMLDYDALGASLSLGQELDAQVVRLPAGQDPASHYMEQAKGEKP